MNYYHIDRQALTILSGPHQLQSAAVRKLTRCGNPELLDLSGFDLVPETFPPLAEGERYTAERNVYTDRVEAVIESTPAADIAAAREQTVQAICDAVKDYVEREINAAGMDLVVQLLQKDPPSSNAALVEQWVKSVYIEAEQRKALVYAGMWPDNADPLDFSVFGKKPVTVATLMMEM